MRITITDKDAVIDFVEVRMSLEDFSNAILGLAHVPCGIQTRGLDHVGMIREQDEIIIELPENSNYHDKELAHNIVNQKLADGWILNDTFSSQGSFF